MSTNKIALITGGSRGLGKNMAIRLAEQGHDVIITYQSNKEAADAVVAEIEAKAGSRLLLYNWMYLISNPCLVFLQEGGVLQSKWGT